MLRSRASTIALALTLVACHRHTRGDESVHTPPAVDNSRREIPADGDPAIAAMFKDTTPANAFNAEGRDYNVQNAAERRELETLIKRERMLWRDRKPRDYRFLLRADCFCPGPHGWLLVEVRADRPLRAWDTRGREVNASQWYTFNIDNLYDTLERINNQQSQVQIAFDERWHYPRYLRTSMIFPDGWSITQVRGFHPLTSQR